MAAWRSSLRVFGAIALLALGGVLILLGVDNILMPLYTRHGHERVTPDVVGQDLAAAKLSLRRAGFRALVEREKPDPTGLFHNGQVMEQFPRAGGATKEGRRVYLTVCAGGRYLHLPDFRGTTERRFLSQLADLGLAIDSTRIQYRFDSLQVAGLVLAHEPAAGCSLLTGESLGVTISLGPEPASVLVPGLLGKSLEEARALLARHGLRVGKTHLILDETAEAGVRRQEPVAGSHLAPGSELELWVKGEQP